MDVKYGESSLRGGWVSKRQNPSDFVSPLSWEVSDLAICLGTGDTPHPSISPLQRQHTTPLSNQSSRHHISLLVSWYNIALSSGGSSRDLDLIDLLPASRAGAGIIRAEQRSPPGLSPSALLVEGIKLAIDYHRS